MAKERKRPASAIKKDSSSPLKAANGSRDATTPDAVASKALNNSNNEVTFGKHLASSNKRVRDRTVTALREWLHQRSRGGALTDLDLLKIWRGLWYCMFMCDKAPVQRELAANLVGLLSLFKDDRSEGVRFFKAFCITMQRDWEKIDNLRIDKYYTLVRVFVREALAFCRVPAAAKTSEASPSKKKSKEKKGKKVSSEQEREMAVVEESSDSAAAAAAEWDLELLGAMSDVMEEEVLTLHPAPIGLRLHLADVWAEEACNAGGGDMPTEAFLVALAPWLRAAAHPETNAVVFKRTFEGIFQGLLEYFPEEGKDGMEEEEEEKVFKAVELDQVQACLFEVAAAPQTREKRRVLLYELHRRYQKRTGMAPDANTPLSGILPLPEVSESDEEDGEDGDGNYDGEYVEAGARPRAVRGPEPAVAGWAAAGIAAGAIRGEGEAEEEEEGGEEKGSKKAKKRKKRSGSVEEEGVDRGSGEVGGEVEVEAEKRQKKKRRSGGVEEAGEEVRKEEEEEGGSAKRKKKKRRASVETSEEEAAVAASAVAEAEAEAAATAVKKSKKRKKAEICLENDAEAAAYGRTSGASLPSPPSSGKRKNKKKRRDSADGTAAAASAPESDAPSAVTEAAAAEVPTPPSSGKKKKKKKKSQEGQEAEVATPDAGVSKTREDATPESESSSGKKKKKKKKRNSLGGAASPSPPAANNASSEESMPPPGNFRTPPKKGSKKSGGSLGELKSPESVESARKTVTFGTNTEKEHIASVEDLKTRVITPAKDAGTPQKGLLKVGGGGSATKPMKPVAGRKDTPFIRKKKTASDFF